MEGSQQWCPDSWLLYSTELNIVTDFLLGDYIEIWEDFQTYSKTAYTANSMTLIRSFDIRAKFLSFGEAENIHPFCKPFQIKLRKPITTYLARTNSPSGSSDEYTSDAKKPEELICFNYITTLTLVDPCQLIHPWQIYDTPNR